MHARKHAFVFVLTRAFFVLTRTNFCAQNYLLSDLETDRKGSHSWHSRPVLFFWIVYKIYIFHAVRAKILMSFFCMNM